MSERSASAFRRVVASVSLGNLVMLQSWLVLFRPGQEAPIEGIVFAAAIPAALLLAAFIWLADLALRQLKEPAGLRLRTIGLALVWVFIAWAAAKPSLLQWLQYAMGTARTPLLASISVAILLLLAVLLRDARRAMRWMGLAALVLSPYALLNICHAGWEARVRGLATPPEERVVVPHLPAGGHRLRTVVLLFDEFDYELGFDPRVRRDALPVLDAMRHHALFATNAYPPMHSTAMSGPAMLTGRLVRDGRFSDAHPGDVVVQFDGGGQGALLSNQPTVFSDLRSRGFTSLRMNDALLPHARLPGSADADIVVPPATDRSTTFGQQVASHLIGIAALLPFARSHALEMRMSEALGVPPASAHVARVADEMVVLASQGDADLLFLHVLLPHLPVVFDPRTNDFASTRSSDYRDNLNGVDRVIGRIMDGLAAAGRLDDTNVVVLSDHFLRTKRAMYGLGDHRIPFIARFAHDARPVGDLATPFNTVLFRQMMVAIVSGDVHDSAGLATWIGSHATFGESPLTEYRKGW